MILYLPVNCNNSFFTNSFANSSFKIIKFSLSIKYEDFKPILFCNLVKTLTISNISELKFSKFILEISNFFSNSFTVSTVSI